MTETAIAVFLLVCGCIFTARLHFFNPNFLFRALLSPFFAPKKRKKNGVSAYSALCTALGGCVGTGNIIGVTACIMTGGAGCVFWIWVCAFLSLATKYTEVYFAALSRDESGRASPLHYIRKFLPPAGKWLGIAWCALLLLSSLFSGGSLQANAISDALTGILPESASLLKARIICGAVIAIVTFIIVIGGIRRVGSIAGLLVPPVCIAYVGVCIACVVVSGADIGGILMKIVSDALSVRSAVFGGGAFVFFRMLRTGVACGVFSNEAGTGTSPLSLCASGDSPRKTAALGMWEIIVDTFIICTSTAFAVLACIPDIAVFSSPAVVMSAVFSGVLGEQGGRIFLAACISLFAYTSILSRSYCGVYCAELLVSKAFSRVYIVIFCITAFAGCLFPLGIIWQLSSTFSMVLAVPNVAALLLIKGTR